MRFYRLKIWHDVNLTPMMSFVLDNKCYNQCAKLGNGVIAPENVCLLSVPITSFLVHHHPHHLGVFSTGSIKLLYF